MIRMRRVIAIFLLLLMPVQFAFAAAAPYCALEKVETQVHFGHHEHGDNVIPVPDDRKSDSTSPDDCGICHLASAQTPASAASTGVVRQAALPHPLPDGRRPQHIQEPTERPPRTSLA